MSGPLESSTGALERINREIDPMEIEMFQAVILQAAAALNEDQPDQAREHLATLLSMTAGLHGLIFLTVPAWCPPQLRAQLQDRVNKLRADIEQKRQVGAQPSTGSIN